MLSQNDFLTPAFYRPNYFGADMTILTITQAPFIVDLESERDTGWPDNSFVFCKDTNKLYQLISGVFIQMNNKAVSQSSTTRSVNNTGFQISTTRDCFANYNVQIACSLSLSGGASGIVFLEISPDNSTGWTELSRLANGNTGSLTIGLNTTQTYAGNLSGFIPAGYYARLRSSNTTGTPVYTYQSGQEVLF